MNKMQKYAQVGPDNIVKNVILWDGAVELPQPEGHFLVLAEEVWCDIGAIHDNGTFTAPPKPDPAPDPAPAEPSNP